jgi:O-antigen/teichoic acid export membrane protein
LKESIVTDAFNLTIAKTIGLGISLISAMLLSRILSLKEFGTYSQILLIINIGTMVFTVGLPKSINYFLARTADENTYKDFLSLYFSFITALSFILGLLLLSISQLLAQYFNNSLINKLSYLLVFMPWAKITISSIDNVLIFYRKTSFLLYYRVFHSIFLVSVILLIELLKLDFLSYMLLYLFTEMAFAFLVYYIINYKISIIRPFFSRRLIKEVIVYSGPIGLASVVGVLKKQMDKIFIAGFCSTEELAIYSNAARELPITVIAASITAVVMPHIVKSIKVEKKKEALFLWHESLVLSLIFINFISFVVYAFANDVFIFLYSSKYSSGVGVFKIYTLILLFRCTYFGMILNATGSTKPILYSSVLSLLLNLILNFIFYSLFGFEGPAIATFVSTMFSTSFLLMFTAKTIKNSIYDIFPWNNVLKILLINVFLAIIFMVVKKFN